MTTVLKAPRYNLRPSPLPDALPLREVAPRPLKAATTPDPAKPQRQPQTVVLRPAPAPAPQAEDGFGDLAFPTSAAALQQMADAPPKTSEQLTARQLRIARRLAAKYDLNPGSDHEAVIMLRARGIDPFKKASILSIVPESDTPPPAPAGRALTVTDQRQTLPQPVKAVSLPSPAQRAEQNHLDDVRQIQRDLAKRRRRRSMLLAARLFLFVVLPTILAGYYYYAIATPFYATKSEFVIQQAEPPTAAAGMGGLLRGTSFATSQDSIAVQGYLQSRDAMLRLDQDQNFIARFQDPTIDILQRLAPDATRESAYKTYQRNVHISYDPTEGLIKMEVIAPDPQASEAFSRALIGYAEEQVDQLTQRLRGDQMKGARTAYEQAEQAMRDAQRHVVDLQEKSKILSSEVEISLLSQQIAQLESQLSTERLSLAQMNANALPNQARLDPVRRRIETLEGEIATLRARMTEGSADKQSIASVQSELIIAQADVQTRQMMLATAMQAMENARTEANRQVRYLSLSVSPIAPDEATYPRAFENTLVAMLILIGLYLMVSMTAAILREQVTS